MILAIVQARVSSSRLPGKVVKDLCGRPMLAWELERIQKSKMIDQVVLATSSESSDDAIEEIFGEDFQVYRGSLDDVLDRFYYAAKDYEPEHVVRLTGDCPLIDPEVIDQVIESHINNKNDYTSNCRPPTFPDGMDVEIFRFECLKTAWEKAKLPSEREHVTPYIAKAMSEIKKGNFENATDLSSLRLTVDEPEDFAVVEKLLSDFLSRDVEVSLTSILEYLDKKPEILNFNKNISRNEGSLKSLQKDQAFLNNEKKSL